ncbi:MAG: glycosyltransferase [Acidimicrobiia bacterium]|nr:glycosyltransferase [Acidimicrobiia bacterium]
MADSPTLSQARTSIVIPSAGHVLPGAETSMLDRCLTTLARLEPLPKEVIVVVGDEFQGNPPQQIAGLPIRVIHRGAGSFDFSRAVNCGLLASRGELVLMLNDDVEAESSDWLGQMAAHLDDPTIGAVGATLLYPDRSIQHIGIEFEGAHPIHSFRGCQVTEAAATGGDTVRDADCVTGACLLARHRDLLAVGGMSLQFPASYGDIDLCLRLTRSGLRVVVESAATLVHHESASRPPVIEGWESDRFIARWGEAPSSFPRSISPGTDHHYDLPMVADLVDGEDRDQPRMVADLVDGEDREELRHEILDLRNRTIGAEAQSRYQRDLIANQENRIAELEDRVAERDARIEEWKDRVRERDTRIAERDTRVAEKDARIAEKDAEILRLHEDLARPAIIRLARRLAHRSRNNAST